jgi:hypothetical protein
MTGLGCRSPKLMAGAGANLAALAAPSGVVGGGRPGATGGNHVLNQETEQLKRDLDTYKARYVVLARLRPP